MQVKHIEGLQEDLYKSIFTLKEATSVISLDACYKFQQIDMDDYTSGIVFTLGENTDVKDYIATMEIMGGSSLPQASCSFDSNFVVDGTFNWSHNYVNYLRLIPTYDKILVLVNK